MEAYERLEKEFGEWIGNKSTVAVSSGTSALHVTLETLNLKPGGEVLVPDYCMIACARAVTMAGLKPVFVDCTVDRLVMNIDDVRKKLTDNTVAIMPVHIYGRLCNMADVFELA